MSDALVELGVAVQAAVTDDEREGGIVTAFVVIAEVRAPDGSTWLCGRHADVMGETLTPWMERGMLSQRLADLDAPVIDDE